MRGEIRWDTYNSKVKIALAYFSCFFFWILPFGYTDLMVDYRNITWMKEINVPVIMDCTHSLQQPNQAGGVTGGNPELIETIAKAAIATGADGLFIETHPDPAVAKSDGANMLRLDLLEGLLEKLVRIRKAL